MMRRFLIVFAIALAALGAWLVVWMGFMAGDVARVKASIDYRYAALRTHDHRMSIEADAVFATGFPFAFKVGVTRATLSMVDGGETFAISIPSMTLTPTDAGQGTYRVNLPDAVEALYAKDGQSPEHYVVRIGGAPELLLSAANGKTRCGPLAGTRCMDLAANAPLMSYALRFQGPVSLKVALGDTKRDVQFETPTMPAAVFQAIPEDLDRALQLAVGVLREAVVFHTPGNEVPAR